MSDDFLLYGHLAVLIGTLILVIATGLFIFRVLKSLDE